MLQTATATVNDTTVTATNSDVFNRTAIARSEWQLPHFALAPKEGEVLRTTDRTGQERVTFVALGDIHVDAEGELVLSVQNTLMRGDALREAIVRPLLEDEVELDARVRLNQVIDCLIETTSLDEGVLDPRFRELHATVADRLRSLLARLERFACPQLKHAA